MNNVLYFAANDGVHGQELWRSDGSAAGTFLVRDILVGNGNGVNFPGNNQGEFIVMNNILYFTATNGYLVPGDYGDELYRSDGTLNGTYMVKDLRTGDIGTYPCQFTVLNDTILFFTASNVLNGTQNIGTELFISDGTENGTSLFLDIRYGPAGSSPEFLTVMNNVLYFAANDGIHGNELWKSDGTRENTFLLIDLSPGPSDSYPTYLTVVNNVLFFLAYTPTTGGELWRSDGSSSNTFLVQDINPGTGNNNAINLAGMNNAVYFQASNGTSGNEPWRCTI